MATLIRGDGTEVGVTPENLRDLKSQRVIIRYLSDVRFALVVAKIDRCGGQPYLIAADGRRIPVTRGAVISVQ